VGAGVERAVAPGWSARVEYLYDRFGGINAVFPSGTQYQSSFDLHTFRLGLNRQFGAGNSGTSGGGFAGDGWPVMVRDWNVHGQTTVIGQGYTSFRSPY